MTMRPNINPTPTAQRLQPTPERLPIAWAFLFAQFVIMVVALIAWLLTRVDWTAVLDQIAPTAAQARDMGWVAIVEGL